MGFLGGITGVVTDILGGGKKQPTGNKSYDTSKDDAIKKRFADLQGKLDAIQGPKTLGPSAPSYKARNPNDIPGVAIAKQNVANQYAAQAGTQTDALSRRFAAMGAGNSGAFLKQQQLALQDAADKSVDAQGGIDYQAAKNEADKEFQSSESTKQQDLQRETYNAESDFKDKVFKFDSTSKLAQLEQGFIQSERDAQDQQFNKEMQQYQQQHSGGLLGAGGFLGTGLGI